MGCKKGERAVNASKSGGGRTFKGGQAVPPPTFDVGHMTLKAPGRTRCPARQHYRSVSMQPCQGTNPEGRLLMLGRRVTGKGGWASSTRHAQSIMGVLSFTTYLFSLLGQSYDSENTGRCTEHHVFLGTLSQKVRFSQTFFFF